MNAIYKGKIGLLKGTIKEISGMWEFKNNNTSIRNVKNPINPETLIKFTSSCHLLYSLHLGFVSILSRNATMQSCICTWLLASAFSPLPSISTRWSMLMSALPPMHKISLQGFGWKQSYGHTYANKEVRCPSETKNIGILPADYSQHEFVQSSDVCDSDAASPGRECLRFH